MASVLVSVEAGVETITLNRPEKLNALNPEMHQLLRAALERAAVDAEIRVVLLTGAGRGFCTGQDLAERDVSAGAEATVGHGAILHGCVVRRGALIGMNCVINDNAEIGEDAVVAALAFVKAEARIPARSLAAGIPARVLRELSEEEIRWKRDNMALYQQLAVRSATTMKEVEALTRVEPGRPRIEIPGSVPLSELKRKHG